MSSAWIFVAGDVTLAIVEWIPTTTALACVNRHLYALLRCQHARLVLTDDQRMIPHPPPCPLFPCLSSPWNRHVNSIRVRKRDPRAVCRCALRWLVNDLRATRLEGVTTLALDLPRTLLGDEVIVALGHAIRAVLPGLRVLRLGLSDNLIGDTGFCGLMDALSDRGLHDLHLDLRGNRLSGGGVGHWASLGLRHLFVDVRDNRLGDATTAALVTTMPTASGRYHWFAGPGAGDRTAFALVERAQYARDVFLGIGTRVGDAGALALAQWPSRSPSTVAAGWKAVLDLSGNLVGNVGARALLAATIAWPDLVVELSDNPRMTLSTSC